MKYGEIGKLLMEHRTAIYGFILTCVRNHHAAEDVFQEVSVAVIESAGSLAGPAGFFPWAREIARRRILAHWRAAGRERPADPELLTCLAESSVRVEKERPSSLEREAFMECLERLPPRARNVMSMRYGGDVASVGEVAVRIGRSVQAVYAMIKRAKSALRSCVERRLTQEVSA